MINEAVTPYSSGEADELPQVFHPWRRYLARTFDNFLYSMMWAAFVALVLQVNIAAGRGGGQLILDIVIGMVLMLFIEPLLLRLFATTPGKAIFGLAVKDARGRHLSYGEGLLRTWGVISRGLGFNIPIYSLVRLWRSYRACQDYEIQPWDEHITYTIKDTNRRRGMYFAVAYGAAVALLFTIYAAQLLPPNRGELSIAQFVDNHNYYAKYYGVDFGRDYLDENGVWREKEYSGTNYYFEPVYNEKPAYHFTVENGFVQGVSFTVEHDNLRSMLSYFDNYMVFATLALAGAQDEMRLLSKLPEQIITEIETHKFQNHQFFAAGLNIEITTEYSGYEIIMDDYLLPMEDTAYHYYKLNFTITR